MKTLDYFYTQYLLPLFDMCVMLGGFIASALLFTVLFVTAPVWLIPYKLMRKTKNDEEGNE